MHLRNAYGFLTRNGSVLSDVDRCTVFGPMLFTIVSYLILESYSIGQGKEMVDRQVSIDYESKSEIDLTVLFYLCKIYSTMSFYVY